MLPRFMPRGRVFRLWRVWCPIVCAMFEIRQTETGYDVLHNGTVVATCTTRELAVASLTTLALATLEQPAPATTLATAPVGALAERWVSGTHGICLNEDTGDGRDFTDCTWSWRDPAVSLLPLMLQTTTDFSHYGAVLAGWMDTLANLDGGGVSAGGWFYDSDAGRQFRDMLMASGRFGVSVDPGEVEWEDVCTEMDPDGFYCVDGYTSFLAYQIIGLTGTPFPAFANAWIELATGSTAPDAESENESADEAGGDEPADAEAARAPAPVAAGGAVVRVDAARFVYPEPRDDDARYVDQGDGRIAIPLTITDDGHVFAHAAAWGTCHIGYRDECVEPPPSPSGYAQFHLGAHPDAGGLATGVLVVNCDHAARNALAAQARDHYAHVGLQWADVRAVDGAHGIWVTGQLRDTVTPELRRVLQASCLSGDWRGFGNELDAVAFQSVSVPGFPVRRQALQAAGGIMLPEPTMRQRRNGDGRILELAGAGIVRPGTARTEALTASATVECLPCAANRRRRGQTAATSSTPAHDPRIDTVMATLDVLERRTRHLVPTEMAAQRARLGMDA